MTDAVWVRTFAPGGGQNVRMTQEEGQWGG
jgi:hypothetical protein